jgi:BirA family biotin operon repressor/biotin-[acetyl-CoA-carboxylase] ligase
VCDVLTQKAPHHEVRVKWPNDVYLGGRKACGILVELPFNAPHRAVIGVGLNINNGFAEAPLELRQTAVSVSDATGQFYDRAAILEEVLVALMRDVESVAANPADLRERWAASCYLTGRLVHLESPAGRTIGLCLGIDSDGALLLQSERGPSRHTSGVIRGIE